MGSIDIQLSEKTIPNLNIMQKRKIEATAFL